MASRPPSSHHSSPSPATDPWRPASSTSMQTHEIPHSKMEDNLANNAPWKLIQQRTFTRWVNQHLSGDGRSIDSLQTGFADGLQLLALVEILSGRKVGKFNQRPTFRSQKLANVSRALEFLEHEEGIKLISIDSMDIVEGRMKLIMGLVWTLILHYSISMQRWEEEDDGKDLSSSKNDKNARLDDISPKQRLLTWFNNKLTGITVRNFTTDWNDGRAAGALDNSIAPGLVPDWQEWTPQNALRNVTTAMDLAEKWLGVSQLIRPEDMIDPHIDEQSMMTYLAQFPAAKVKAGAPLQSEPALRLDEVKVGGRGLQPRGIRVGDVVQVKVGGARDDRLTVDIVNHSSQSALTTQPEVEVDQLGRRCFTYQPLVTGDYTVSIKYHGHHVGKSPYSVHVMDKTVSRVRVYGPGLTGGAVGHAAQFAVDMNGEVGRLGIEIEGPSEVVIEAREKEEYVISAQYVPLAVGEYAVHVMTGDEDIAGSPFMADVVELRADSKPDKVRVVLGVTSLVGGQVSEVLVDAREAGSGQVEMKVVDTSDWSEVGTSCEERDEVYAFRFVPENGGRHLVMVEFEGVACVGSPFKLGGVEDEEDDLDEVFEREKPEVQEAHVRITGLPPSVPLNKLITFNIDATATLNGVQSTSAEPVVDIVSPSGIPTRALISTRKPGVYNAAFSVFEEGDHQVGVSLAGSPVGQPIRVSVQPASSPQPKLNAEYREQQQQQQETVSVVSREQYSVERSFARKISHVECVSAVATKCQGDTSVSDGSGLVVGKMANVMIDGMGEIGISELVDIKETRVGRVNSFQVDADRLEYNVLLVGIRGKVVNSHRVQVEHLTHCRYQVEYILQEVGDYLLTVQYGDRQIPGSPFLVSCL